jgi:hypothetical protein
MTRPVDVSFKGLHLHTFRLNGHRQVIKNKFYLIPGFFKSYFFVMRWDR